MERANNTAISSVDSTGANGGEEEEEEEEEEDDDDGDGYGGDKQRERWC